MDSKFWRWRFVDGPLCLIAVAAAACSGPDCGAKREIDPAGHLWPPCNCEAFDPRSTTLPPQHFDPTPPPVFKAEVEVLSVDVTLANRVRCGNASLAADVASSLGVPADRVRIVPWSWTPDHPVHMALLQDATTQFGRRTRCSCSGTAISTAPASAPQDPGTAIGSAVDINARINARLPPARLQMLTRDPCLVMRLRADPLWFEEEIAKLLNVSVEQIHLQPPMLQGAAGPASAPSPAPAAGPASFISLSSSGGGCVIHQQHHTASGPAPAGAPGLAPAGAPGPAPAPAGGDPTEVNRPWIAWWSITVSPPDAEEIAEKLLFLKDTQDNVLSQLLPLTLARVPGLAYPSYDETNALHETRLPPPRDTAISLGMNVGGLDAERGQAHPITMGFSPPATEAEETAMAESHSAEDAIREGLELRTLIKGSMFRATQAARMHRDALLDHPMQTLNLVPPMVAIDGPDGYHTESPYGPWPPGPPFASRATTPPPDDDDRFRNEAPGAAGWLKPPPLPDHLALLGGKRRASSLRKLKN